MRVFSLLATLILLLAPASQARLVSPPPPSLLSQPSTSENASTAFFEGRSESRIGLLCHNDPVNRNDPLGLQDLPTLGEVWQVMKVALDAQPPRDKAQAGAAGAMRQAMMVTGAGPGKLGPILSRYPRAAESVEKLAADAARAEKAIGIHGVSATEGKLGRDAAVASKQEVEKHFPVHNTGREPHRTIELPKPVTEAVRKLFNKLFHRE